MSTKKSKKQSIASSQAVYIINCSQAIEARNLEKFKSLHTKAAKDKQNDMAYYIYLAQACIRSANAEAIEYLYETDPLFKLDMLFSQALKKQNTLITSLIINKLNYQITPELLSRIKEGAAINLSIYPQVLAQVEKKEFDHEISLKSTLNSMGDNQELKKVINKAKL